MTIYNFTLKTVSGKFEIGIDPIAQYGYFEHETLGDECGGGLWFEKGRLIDYDGVFSPPKSVIKGIREVGFIVPRDFE